MNRSLESSGEAGRGCHGAAPTDVGSVLMASREKGESVLGTVTTLVEWNHSTEHGRVSHLYSVAFGLSMR